MKHIFILAFLVGMLVSLLITQYRLTGKIDISTRVTEFCDQQTN